MGLSFRQTHRTGNVGRDLGIKGIKGISSQRYHSWWAFGVAVEEEKVAIEELAVVVNRDLSYPDCDAFQSFRVFKNTLRSCRDTEGGWY